MVELIQKSVYGKVLKKNNKNDTIYSNSGSLQNDYA